MTVLVKASGELLDFKEVGFVGDFPKLNIIIGSVDEAMNVVICELAGGRQIELIDMHLFIVATFTFRKGFGAIRGSKDDFVFRLQRDVLELDTLSKIVAFQIRVVVTSFA